MIRRLRQMLSVLLVVGCGLVFSSTAASASPSRTTLQNAASRVTYEPQGGPAYSYYHKKYPTQLNWTKDGCSVPRGMLSFPGLGAVLRNYSNVFRHSCDRHDFGYRNYGSNTHTPGPHPEFDAWQYRKDTIDRAFLVNMGIQCRKTYPAGGGRNACYVAAGIFYKAVNSTKAGHDAFFG